MKEVVKKNVLQIVLAAAGAAGGFLYWKYVGCESGTCPIKSVWYLSTLWGMIMGYLTGSIIKDIIVRFREKKITGQTDDHNQV